MTAEIHLTLAPWNILAIVEKTTSPLCVLSSGHFPSEQGLYHLHCTFGVQSDTHCVAGHGARETQCPEPGFASVGSLAQVRNVGIHSAQETVRWNREEEIRPFSSLLLLYLSTPAETPMLYSSWDFLFSKEHRMRTEGMELTIHGGKARGKGHRVYTVLTVNIEVEQVRKGKNFWIEG